MIYLKIDGRLGNQMFQYAFARTLSLKYNEDLYISFENILKRNDSENGWENALKYFNIKSYKEVEKIEITFIQHWVLNFFYAVIKIRKIPFHKRTKTEINWARFLNYFGLYLMTEGYYPFKKSKFKNKILIGNFESSKYFDEYKEIIINEFVPKYKRIKDNSQLYKEIEDSESVCISIRRGDFLNFENSSYGYVCTPKYFELAIDKINKLVKKPKFIVFSDDIEWVKNNMIFPKGTSYESGKDPIYEKLRLMYSCKHFIISNSSFSWWTAYLSRNSKKVVIAPSKWRKYDMPQDIYENYFILINPERSLD